MKKLTAGIFATLLTVVTVGAANAEIASKTYVDDQVGTKAEASTVTALQGTVNDQGTRLTTAEDDIDSLETNVALKANSADVYTKGEVDTELGKKQTSALIKSAQYNANTTNDDAYPSVAAVAGAITAVSGDVTGVTETVTELQGTVDGLQENVTGLQNTKQNKNMGAEAANKIVTTDGTGNITTSDDIAASKVTGLAGVATTGAYGDLTGTPTLGALAEKDTVSAAEIDANAVTTAKIADKNVTKAKLADDVQASLGRADSALQQADLADYAKTADVDADLALKQDKTDNTLATTAKTVVGAINEVNTKAGTAATNAAQAKSDAAQAKTDAAQAKTDATQAKSDAAAATTAATTATETATQAKSTADTASQTATQAKSTAEEAKTTAGEAKTAALAAIPKPTDPSCDNPTNKCVLTYNNSAYEWEVVAR